jgi:predicted transcriptional regulator of viral defense system
MRNPTSDAIKKAEGIFTQRSGILRTSEAIAAGIQPRTLYWMRDNGLTEALSRGLFHLASYPLPERPDIVAVAQRIPAGIIALVSALDLHELTTRIPEAVYVALPRDVKHPRIDYPPVRIVHLSASAMAAGVEERRIGETTVRLFSVAKTVADCFKFRSIVGGDYAVEALREALRSRKATPADVMRCAKIDRVAPLVRPYLEALQ